MPKLNNASAPTPAKPPRKPTKRVKPIFARVGGKYNLAKCISALLDDWTDPYFVDVFCGAGNICFAKAPCKGEIINDINNDIVTTFRVAQNHPLGLIEAMDLMVPSRKEFERQRKLDPAHLTDIQRAVRWLYTTRFSMIGRGGYFKTVHSPEERLNWGQEPQFEKIRALHHRLQNVTIEHLPWQECIRRYDRATDLCFYLDPPYEQRDTLYGKGIWEDSDHDRLAQACRSLNGHFLLSINDSPRIRALYQGFHIAEVELVYFASPTRAKRQELLIADRPISQEILRAHKRLPEQA